MFGKLQWPPQSVLCHFTKRYSTNFCKMPHPLTYRNLQIKLNYQSLFRSICRPMLHRCRRQNLLLQELGQRRLENRKRQVPEPRWPLSGRPLVWQAKLSPKVSKPFCWVGWGEGWPIALKLFWRNSWILENLDFPLSWNSKNRPF